jgi:phenylalanyl-tRNA synthetase beta chain
LSTDASYRFERGVDPTAQEAALRRCVELILAIAGGEADPAGVRAGPEPAARPRLPLRPARVRQVLGLSLDGREIAGLLDPIGLAVSGEGDRLDVAVPGWRGDVEREIDLVEEVARRYGFERFPDESRAFRPSAVPATPGVERARLARELLTARGLYEARSLTFVPEEYRGHRSEVVIPNPLSAEESALRSALVPALLRRLELNFARGRRDVRLFEIGTVFRYAEDPPAADPKSPGIERFAETRRVGLLLTGARSPSHWSDGGDAPDVDMWDLKGLAEEIAETLVGGSVVPGAPPDAGRFRPVSWIADAAYRLERKGEVVGWLGPVRPTSLDAPPWAGPVYALEMELDAVRLDRTVTYERASAYPAVRRDLSVLVPGGTGAADIEGVLRESASSLLESVRLFDVYEGDNGDGRRSLGWAFRFRAADRTLTDDEVEREMAAIRAALEERFDARIRTS